MLSWCSSDLKRAGDESYVLYNNENLRLTQRTTIMTSNTEVNIDILAMRDHIWAQDFIVLSVCSDGVDWTICLNSVSLISSANWTTIFETPLSSVISESMILMHQQTILSGDSFVWLTSLTS
jgi:hypothetical protein